MNKEELEKVEQLIEQKNSEELKGLLSGLHPADIAELCNELDAEEAEVHHQDLLHRHQRFGADDAGLRHCVAHRVPPFAPSR